MKRMTYYRIRLHRGVYLLPLILLVCLCLLLAGCGSNEEEKLRDAASRAAKAQELFDAEQYSQAFLYIKEAIAMNVGISNDTALAENDLLAARCQRQLGEYDAALASYQSAVQRSHGLSDRNRERKALIALAEFHSLMSRDNDALTIAADAATSAKLFANVEDAYRAMTIVATVCHKLQRYDKEVKTLEELLVLDSLSRKERDRNHLYALLFRAATSANKGIRSNDVFNRWLSASKRTSDDRGLGTAYYELGRYYATANRPDSALRSFSIALEKLSSVDDRLLQADVWTAIGYAAYNQHQYENARTYFSNALERTGQLGGFAPTQLLRLSILSCEWKLNSASPSQEYLAHIFALRDSCKRNGFWRGEAFTLILSGMVHEKFNDQASAIQSSREALRIIDRTVPGAETDERDFADVFFAGERTDWYSTCVQLECARGNADSAFTVLEQKNLRDLIDFFSRTNLKTPDAKINQSIENVEWQYNEIRLNERDVLDELRRYGRKSDDRLNSLVNRYAQHRENLTKCIQALQEVSPNFGRLFSLEPLTVRSIRKTLPAQSVLVEFAPTANTLYSIIIRPDTAYVRKTNATSQYLSSVIRDYMQLMGELRLTTYGLRMSEPAALKRINELSSVLHTLLIAPILSDIRNAQKLYVVLPEEFEWLPVHTLRGEGGALGERVNVSYLPTASALLFQQHQERWAKKIVGVGHPGTTGWDVEYELKDIRSFFDGVGLLFDTAATLNHLVDSTYDVLHIAAEFYLDRAVPEKSHAVLADEARPVGLRNVQLGEMLKIPAPQTLVFSNISATPGGLSRYAPLAFLANGTRTVIASMWQGDRRAKKAFGEGLYTNLFGAVPAGEAYYRAIVGMAKRDEMSHVQRWGMYYQFGK